MNRVNSVLRKTRGVHHNLKLFTESENGFGKQDRLDTEM